MVSAAHVADGRARSRPLSGTCVDGHIQAVYHMPTEDVEEASADRSIPLALQRVFYNLQVRVVVGTLL